MVPERSTARYTGVLIDETGAAIAAAALTTLTLTLYALDDALTIVNGVNAVSILNTGRGTVDGSGNLAVLLTPDDNQLVDTAQSTERHVALIQWTYAAGARAVRHEVEFQVRNLAKV